MLIANHYFFNGGNEVLDGSSFESKMTRLGLGCLVALKFFFRELTSMRYISFASLFLLVYLGVVMVIEAPE
jgi:hypothetical protein